MSILTLIIISQQLAILSASEQSRAVEVVEYRLLLTPDSAARELGVEPFFHRASLTDTWVDEFTGWGCVTGNMSAATIHSRETDGAFEVSCAARDTSDDVSRIEWKGQRHSETLSGEMWITLRGEMLTRAQLLANHVDAETVRRENTITIGGRVMNADVVEHRVNEAARAHALFAARGRRLHFSFSTSDVIKKSSDADRPRTAVPATQPSTRPAPPR